jgi:DNA ligase-1
LKESTEYKVVFSGSPMLAKEYIDKNGKRSIDPVNWWASEKFDGYRAIWNGKSFVSRNGKPDWFRNLMPHGVALDGEFWMGRGKFQNCGIFRRKNPDPEEWKNAGVQYTVYDIPSIGDYSFEERMKILKELVHLQCKKIKNCPLRYTEQIKIKSVKQLDDLFNKVVSQGGEGIMLRKPNSKYEQKRTSALLKYKQFGDTECRIVGYKMGTGKYENLLGSFECELLKGTKQRFYVSGMNDCIRKTYKKTHPIGTIITITFNEKTNDGIPRFPRYLRKRDDHDL